MCSRLPVSSRSNRRRCAGKSRRFSGTSRPRELTRLVIAGLDPAIHLSRNLLKTDGWPGLHRAEGQFVLSVACTASAPQAGQARPRREGVQCRRAAPHPGREGAYYFRTQITRTTAALASVEVPAAAISCAFRKSRTVSPVTSTDRKSTRLNSSHSQISYAVFCLKKKKKKKKNPHLKKKNTKPPNY